MQVIAVVGRSDGSLEQLLKQSGRTVLSMPGGDTAARGSGKVDVIVIDARGLQHLPGFVTSLARDARGAGFVLVASSLDPSLMLEAMRAGIRECVPEPVTAEALQAAVARVVTADAVSGAVFAFVGAKGGVGTTTAAVNVAMELSRIAPNKTLLIDLHLSNGDAGLFLGEEARFSIADALDNAHRLDEAFLRTLVVRTKGHLDLLASPDSSGFHSVEAGRVRSLLEFAARQYRFTVLDVSRSEPAVLEALEPADRIVLVANQELATVRSAARMATVLRQRYGKERITLAVARYDANAGIGQDDIERAVGVKVRHVLPSDYRRAVEALNSGRPLSLGNHNALAGSFRLLARDLGGFGVEEASAKPGPGLLGRLTGRRN